MHKQSNIIGGFSIKHWNSTSLRSMITYGTLFTHLLNNKTEFAENPIKE
jgi:hypothetical protein